MRWEHDPHVDAAYLHLAESVSEGEAITQVTVQPPREGHGELVLDFDRQGRLVGIEVLGVSTLLPPGIL